MQSGTTNSNKDNALLTTNQSLHNDMDTAITRKVFGWKGLNTLCYITEGGKATLDVRRSFYFFNQIVFVQFMLEFFFFFGVNIELAQYASVHKKTMKVGHKELRK